MGQSGFAEIQRSAFKGASGAFIVLDLSRRETYESFHKWMFSLYKVTGEIPVVVMANKKDLKHTFGKEDLEKLVKEYGFPFYFTSAKTGENVNEAFHTLGKMMLKPYRGIDFSAQFSKALKSEKAPVEIPVGQLSVKEAEDMITARFCDLLDDPEYAMAIVRKQFANAKVDFNKPTMEGLSRVVDMLIAAASNQVESSKLEREKKEYRNLLRRIA
jgi:Fe2+ transport system protein B